MQLLEYFNRNIPLLTSDYSKRRTIQNAMTVRIAHNHYINALKPTGTKACLRERILGGAYFNEGVCDVNHNSLQFGTRILVCTIM